MRIKLIGFRRHSVRPQFANIPEADPAYLERLSAIIRDVGIEELILA
jgi:succinylglutamate desuccinylase